MGRIKQFLAVFVILALLTGSLVGCGSAGKDNTATTAPNSESTKAVDSGTTAGETENPYKDTVEFTASWFDIAKYMSEPEKDELAQYYFKKFNIKIKAVPVTWNDYREKYLMWAASGQLPDTFMFNITNSDESQTYKNWTEQGIVKALPDDLSPYPNLQKIMSQPDVEATRNEDGHFYQFVVSAYSTKDGWASDRNLLVRKDWMEKLGIKDPQNFDEFVAMCKAFTEKDPDGNGKADTIGFAPAFYPYMSQLALATDLPQVANGAWLKENDKWIPYYASSKYPTYLKMLRELYTENALDKDFAVRKDSEGTELFCQGKTGCLAYGSPPSSLAGTFATNFEKYTGKKFLDSVKVLRLWKSSEGNVYHYTDSTFWNNILFNAKTVDDKKMDRILRFLDYANSEEGRNVSRYGIPDKDFKMENGEPVITRAKNSDGSYPALDTVYPSTLFFQYFPGSASDLQYKMDVGNKSLYGEDLLKYTVDEHQYQLDNTKSIPINFDVNAINTTAKTKFSSVSIKDEVIKVILGKDDPEKMWQSVLQKFSKEGMQTMLDEVNAEAQKKGLN